MPAESLSAPWRMAYIRSLDKHSSPDRCFLCEAAMAGDDTQMAQRLVLWQTELIVVLMNRFPYANGHLLVTPRAHKPDLEELSEAEITDIGVQTVRAVRLLKRAVSAQGFNIGTNLGRVAGAGVPGHIHQHIVPRWSGDTNFMHVIGDTGVVPQAIEQLHVELLRRLKEE